MPDLIGHGQCLFTLIEGVDRHSDNQTDEDSSGQQQRCNALFQGLGQKRVELS